MDTPKHCWECSRRSLVCDGVRPECRRCSSSGVTCPGYGKTKPLRLRFLAPGQVNSQTRRKRSKPARNTTQHTPSPQAEDGNKGKITETALARPRPKPDAKAETPPQQDFSVLTPRYELTTDICALFDAGLYYNSCIHPDMLPVHQFGINNHIYPLLPVHLQAGLALPDHVRLGLICNSISHRAYRLGGAQMKVWEEKFYRYRGLIIRSLAADIADELKHASFVTIAGVMSLLLSDNQQTASPDWPCHIEVMRRQLELRGGVPKLAKIPGLGAFIRAFIMIPTIGNTTTPASNLVMTQWIVDHLDVVVKLAFETVTPFELFPPLLFSEVIRINHIRYRASQMTETSGLGLLTIEARDILENIDDFSPTEWGSSKAKFQDEWSDVATACQASVTIYCVKSLQSLGILPREEDFGLDKQHTKLWPPLRRTLALDSARRFTLWPLLMFGMTSRHDAEAQLFIEKWLPELSRFTGTRPPLTALEVLRRYWESDEDNWETCFDRPYSFTAQWAVDIRGMMFLD